MSPEVHQLEANAVCLAFDSEMGVYTSKYLCFFTEKDTLWGRLEGTKMVELKYVKPKGAADAGDDSL